MSEHALPALFAIFIWWLSTGLILVMDSLPKRTFQWSMLGATALGGIALYALIATRNDASITGAYVAFLSGLAIWGWHEMSFLMGFLTGPRRAPCPADCSALQRFSYAAQTVLHHELAIAGTALGLVVLTWGAVNQIGTLTFLVLWVMRLSAKLNIFLGVPYFTDEFLPDHLQFLKSYFRKGPANAFFPIAMVATALAIAGLLYTAHKPGTQAFEATGAGLLATLLALGALEHMFMVLPIRDSALWMWMRPKSAVRLPATGCPEPNRRRRSPVSPPQSGKDHQSKAVLRPPRTDGHPDRLHYTAYRSGFAFSSGRQTGPASLRAQPLAEARPVRYTSAGRRTGR